MQYVQFDRDSSVECRFNTEDTGLEER